MARLAGHVDETCVRVNGSRCNLWRAVDRPSQLIDVRLTARRNAKAAKAVIRQTRETPIALSRLVQSRKSLSVTVGAPLSSKTQLADALPSASPISKQRVIAPVQCIVAIKRQQDGTREPDIASPENRVVATVPAQVVIFIKGQNGLEMVQTKD
jgi:hypothetical protein